ncbi:ABC transporter permease subunit [Leucobacter luti]|uniref:Amino acid/amide ABC transporter membrane protein 2 (HAAT family) /amino acid/amide ABC transporter ATP-binding protein 1 (HAAT family) n=1 Tax=Leucobacter luti TaxID=340320 RepID=A0A4Q7U958_9MICO|nr:ATP-binding cassette domain-containing protein [Leucobacter luti]MBL3700987.1 ATP-binding cassette domain-containing protein [Leucobacter luti]RZT68792.1 amino acid/amide ABC transporter membrane protein 2 (HAAT family) /amino acid/amide ABC transporter ATP-binding protein 1 (HAAT family) [Leucobacter luti]
MLLANRKARALAPVVVAVLALAIGWALSVGLSGYVVYLAVSMVTATIAVLGLGVVTGSAGIIALCQLTFAAIGAWVVAWLNVNDAPGGFAVWLVAGALVAGIAGVLIGLPALRLRGVNLAVVTLGFAAAFDVMLVQTQFPGQADGVSVARPGLFSSDREYFFFCMIVLVVCALGVYALQRSRVGSSWKAVAFSERGTAAVGQSVRLAKLSAFAVSAALGGVSGGLLAGQVGIPYASSFTPIQSLAIYILAVMSGAYLIDMAIFGGILWVLVPELLKRWGIPQDWGFVVFGLLGIQALTSGSNLGEAIRGVFRSRVKRRRAAVVAATAAATEDATTTALDAFAVPEAALPVPADAGPVLEVRGLGVQFGTLKALDDVTLQVRPRSIMGLIGPNGAGKSTFVDAVSGFLPQHTGSVLLDGEDITALTPTARARRGLRRTFQQDRVPPQLTVEAYVRFVARRRLDHDELAEALAFLGCPPPEEHLSNVDVGTRRLIEVAAAVLSGPKVLILDEPAAGLSHEEHLQFGQRLTRIPSRFDTAIVIIEHDLDLVRTVCTEITVLDFGRVLAQGAQQDVLDNPAVIAAYMGDAEIGS